MNFLTVKTTIKVSLLKTKLLNKYNKKIIEKVNRNGMINEKRSNTKEKKIS